MKEKHDKHTAMLITDDVDKQKNLQTTIAHIELYRSGATSGQMFHHIIEMPLFTSSATCVGYNLRIFVVTTSIGDLRTGTLTMRFSRRLSRSSTIRVTHDKTNWTG